MKSRFAWAVLLPVLTVGYWIALFVATHIPAPPRILSHGRDKILHFSAFALLGFLVTVVVHSWRRPSWQLTAGIIVSLAIYGVIDEYLQAVLTTTRTADWKDWVMDVAGATAGTIAAVVFAKITARPEIARSRKDDPDGRSS